MKNIVVVGSQWGDEGKGKIVDWLSEQADVVIRFQGGHNAGHTLVIDGITSERSEKSCQFMEIPAALAIATRCKVWFVEPPVASNPIIPFTMHFSSIILPMVLD